MLVRPTVLQASPEFGIGRRGLVQDSGGRQHPLALRGGRVGGPEAGAAAAHAAPHLPGHKRYQQHDASHCGDGGAKAAERRRVVVGRGAGGGGGGG